MSATCPKGHSSDEPDYCSVCGLAIPVSNVGKAGATSSSTSSGSSSGTVAGSANGKSCPVCNEVRSDMSARFCEVCRFDFVSGKPGPPPSAPTSLDPLLMGAVTAPIPKPTTIPIAPPAASASTTSSAVGSTAAPQPAPVAVHAWEAVVSIDPKLDTDPDPSAPCPQGEPERIFPLDLAENLIGRRDDKNNIRPQIPLNDPGASRRHAKLLCAPDGTLALQDLASANGTTVNNQEVPAGTKRSLAAGDAITLGRWTRIVVRDRT